MAMRQNKLIAQHGAASSALALDRPAAPASCLAVKGEAGPLGTMGNGPNTSLSKRGESLAQALMVGRHSLGAQADTASSAASQPIEQKHENARRIAKTVRVSTDLNDRFKRLAKASYRTHQSLMLSMIEEAVTRYENERFG